MSAEVYNSDAPDYKDLIRLIGKRIILEYSRGFEVKTINCVLAGVEDLFIIVKCGNIEKRFCIYQIISIEANWGVDYESS